MNMTLKTHTWCATQPDLRSSLSLAIPNVSDRTKKPSSGLNSVRNSLISNSNLTATRWEIDCRPTSKKPRKAQPAENVKKPIFAGKVFAVEFGGTTSFKQKSFFREKITGHAGIISHIITYKVDYFVLHAGVDQSSYKCRKASSLNIPLLHHSYITQCTDAAMLLPIDGFLIVAESVRKQLETGHISSSTRPMVHNVRGLVDWGKYDPMTSQTARSYFERCKYDVAKWRILHSPFSEGSGLNVIILEIHQLSAEGGMKTKLFTVYLQQVNQAGHVVKEEVRPVDTPTEAERLMESLYVHYSTKKGFKDGSVAVLPNCVREMLGSPELRLSLHSSSFTLDEDLQPCVRSLVNSVWNNTMSAVRDYQPDISSLSPISITHAQAKLQLMKKQLKQDENIDPELISGVQNDLKLVSRPDIRTVKDISTLADLVQLMKDIYLTSEALNWQQNLNAAAKLHSLNADIRLADRHIVNRQRELFHQKMPDYKISNVYKLTLQSDLQFRRQSSNQKLLYHATKPENMLGVISRGLLLPDVVVDDYGVVRSDYGLLGAGLYFAESPALSHKYTTPVNEKGHRLMMVCTVDLGTTFETEEEMSDLTCPPDGYQSVHGVPGSGSVFKDDEYVIYDKGRQRIEYIIEYVHRDKKCGSTSLDDGRDYESLEALNIDTDSPASIAELESKRGDAPPASLTANGVALPLKSFAVTANIVDLAAEVMLVQEYYSENSANVEAKFAFPLATGSAVCGFEAYIGDKHVIGEVKEKEKAHKEYREAVSKGHGAYLMDQHEERDDIFTVNIGNLPPHTRVLIKISYVCELKADLDKLVFHIPNNVAPWVSDEVTNVQTQSDTTTIYMPSGKQPKMKSLVVTLDMPRNILSVTSPTHDVNSKSTDTMAIVMLENKPFDDGFTLSIGLDHIHAPRLVVENSDEEDSDSQACMLSFHPEFDAPSDPCYDLTILVDVSRSIAHTAGGLTRLTSVAAYLLSLVPNSAFVNVVAFAQGFRELFIQPKVCNKTTRRQILDFLASLRVQAENTHILQPLVQFRRLTAPKDGVLHNVVVISDGHLQSLSETFNVVQDFPHNLRLFTLAIGSDADVHSMRRLATLGNGSSEHLDDSIAHTWREKISLISSKLSQHYLSDVRVCWANDASPAQAPHQLPAVYNGERVLVYGLCTRSSIQQATLKAKLNKQEVEIVVYTSPLLAKHAMLIHRLAARAMIQDWTRGSLNNNQIIHQMTKEEKKQEIISLSVQYGIISQFTSYVAIEKREEGELFDKQAPRVAELVDDFLSESPVGWKLLDFIGLHESSDVSRSDAELDINPDYGDPDFSSDVSERREKLDDLIEKGATLQYQGRMFSAENQAHDEEEVYEYVQCASLSSEESECFEIDQCYLDEYKCTAADENLAPARAFTSKSALTTTSEPGEIYANLSAKILPMINSHDVEEATVADSLVISDEVHGQESSVAEISSIKELIALAYENSLARSADFTATDYSQPQLQQVTTLSDSLTSYNVPTERFANAKQIVADSLSLRGTIHEDISAEPYELSHEARSFGVNETIELTQELPISRKADKFWSESREHPPSSTESLGSPSLPKPSSSLYGSSFRYSSRNVSLPSMAARVQPSPPIPHSVVRSSTSYNADLSSDYLTAPEMAGILPPPPMGGATDAANFSTAFGGPAPTRGASLLVSTSQMLRPSLFGSSAAVPEKSNFSSSQNPSMFGASKFGSSVGFGGSTRARGVPPPPLAGMTPAHSMFGASGFGTSFGFGGSSPGGKVLIPPPSTPPPPPTQCIPLPPPRRLASASSNFGDSGFGSSVGFSGSTSAGEVPPPPLLGIMPTRSKSEASGFGSSAVFGRSTCAGRVPPPPLEGMTPAHSIFGTSGFRPSSGFGGSSPGGKVPIPPPIAPPPPPTESIPPPPLGRVACFRSSRIDRISRVFPDSVGFFLSNESTPTPPLPAHTTFSDTQPAPTPAPRRLEKETFEARTYISKEAVNQSLQEMDARVAPHTDTSSIRNWSARSLPAAFGVVKEPEIALLHRQTKLKKRFKKPLRGCFLEEGDRTGDELVKQQTLRKSRLESLNTRIMQTERLVGDFHAEVKSAKKKKELPGLSKKMSHMVDSQGDFEVTEWLDAGIEPPRSVRPLAQLMDYTKTKKGAALKIHIDKIYACLPGQNILERILGQNIHPMSGLLLALLELIVIIFECTNLANIRDSKNVRELTINPGKDLTEHSPSFTKVSSYFGYSNPLLLARFIVAKFIWGNQQYSANIEMQISPVTVDVK